MPKKTVEQPKQTPIKKVRTMCQIQKDWIALNKFFDQGIISPEAFEKRKQTLMDELEGK